MLKRIAVMIASMAILFAVQAQPNLGEMVASAKVDWILGDWQATTDNGDTFFLAFKADLNNRIGFINYKDARSESKGIVVVDPKDGMPKYYAGNDQGDFGTGVWSVEGEKAVLKYKSTNRNGETSRMGFTFAKVDPNTMEVKVFELSSDDQLVGEARGTLQFKRKK